MGEYAKRKSDHQEIKIGTCESMYYLRYEDREKVFNISGSLNPSREKNLFWRLPFPDEDRTKIGEYENYNRGLRLYKTEKDNRKNDYNVDYTNPELTEHAGILQLKHEASGLLVNMPCHHGERLPQLKDGEKEVRTFWNGKGHSWELAFIKNNFL